MVRISYMYLVSYNDVLSLRPEGLVYSSLSHVRCKDGYLLLLLLLLLFIPLSLSTEHRASTVPLHPRLLFQFLGSIRHLVGLLGGGISPAQGLYLHRTTQHRKTQRSMPRAGFETAIPMFERPKTVLVLDCSAIETGVCTSIPKPIPLRVTCSCHASYLPYSESQPLSQSRRAVSRGKSDKSF
jgi:hypothetical protein